MSESQSISDAPQTESSASSEKETKQQDTVAYDTYKRTVGEAKRLKEERALLKEELDSFKQKDLESQGKKDELISALRGQLDETKTLLKEERGNYAWNAISGQIREKAAKKGCQDVDLFLKTVDESALGSLQVGDSKTNFKVHDDDLEHLIESGRKKHSVLFGQKVNISDGVPTKKVELDKKVSLDDLSIEDAIKLAKEKFSN